MNGPYEVADERGVYFEYTCPQCGRVCHRFRWEWPAEQENDPAIRSLRDYYADPSYRK
jgi:hypothetical protein